MPSSRSNGGILNGSSNNEQTPLLSGGTHGDESKWKAMPKHVARTVWATLCSNYVNVLLVFVPIGIIAGAVGWNPVAVFCLNFVAIVPLAALLSFATEEISAKLGQTLGGLMNATFGNAVELIVGGSAPDAHSAMWLTNASRSPSLRCVRARFASSSLACSVAFSPTSSL
jgi:Ca2+:H+ antiporter